MNNLPNVLIKIISTYLIQPQYKLLDWVDENKLNWEYLSLNPSHKAIPLLLKNLDKINWKYLSGNPSPGTIPILEKNLSAYIRKSFRFSN